MECLQNCLKSLQMQQQKLKKKRGGEGDTGKRADWPETENSISASMGKSKAPEWCCRGLTEGFSCILVSHPLPLTALFFAFFFNLFYTICVCRSLICVGLSENFKPEMTPSVCVCVCKGETQRQGDLKCRSKMHNLEMRCRKKTYKGDWDRAATCVCVCV